VTLLFQRRGFGEVELGGEDRDEAEPVGHSDG
jgi:hypothetical protein